MPCRGREVGVAEAPEDTKRRVVRVRAVEKEEGCVVVAWIARSSVEKKRGRLKGFSPVLIWHVGVN